MAVYKRGGVWWFKFTWNGELIRESTKQANKRVAEQIESARKTQFAKGEVGLRDRVPVPTLKDFAEHDFKPHIESHFMDKPNTLMYYRFGVKSLLEFAPLANSGLDMITGERSRPLLQGSVTAVWRCRASIVNWRFCVEF